MPIPLFFRARGGPPIPFAPIADQRCSRFQVKSIAGCLATAPARRRYECNISMRHAHNAQPHRLRLVTLHGDDPG